MAGEKIFLSISLEVNNQIILLLTSRLVSRKKTSFKTSDPFRLLSDNTLETKCRGQDFLKISKLGVRDYARNYNIP